MNKFLNKLKKHDSNYWQYIIPVEDNSKKPRTLYNKDGDSIDWSSFNQFFKDTKTEKDILDIIENSNYGITPLPNLIYIDVDEKEGKPSGNISLIQIFKNIGLSEENLKKHFTTTPNGGKHYYIKVSNKPENLPNKTSIKDFPSVEFMIGEGSKIMCVGSSINGINYKLNPKAEIIELTKEQEEKLFEMLSYKKTSNFDYDEGVIELKEENLKFINNWLKTQDSTIYNTWISVSFRLAGVIKNSKWVGKTENIDIKKVITVQFVEWSLQSGNPDYTMNKAKDQLEYALINYQSNRTNYKYVCGFYQKKEQFTEEAPIDDREEDEYDLDTDDAEEYEIYQMCNEAKKYIYVVMGSSKNGIPKPTYYFKNPHNYDVEIKSNLKEMMMFLYMNKWIEGNYLQFITDFSKEKKDKHKTDDIISRFENIMLKILYQSYRVMDGTVCLPHWKEVVFIDNEGKIYDKFSKELRKPKRVLNLSYLKPIFKENQITSLKDRDKFFENLDKLFLYNCSNSKEEAEFIKKIFKISIFKPELKLGFAPVFTGVGNTGKSTLIKLLKVCLFDGFSNERGSSISGNFDPPSYETSKVIYIEDVPKLDQKQTNNLKPLFDDNSVKIRRMYQESKEIFRMFNLFFTSNEIDPFSNTKGERRFYYLMCIKNREITDEWLKEINISINENPALVYEYFKNRVELDEEKDKFIHLSPKVSDTQIAYIESKKHDIFPYLEFYEKTLGDFKIDGNIETPFTLQDFRNRIKSKIDEENSDKIYSQREIDKIIKIQTLKKYINTENLILSPKELRLGTKKQRVYFKYALSNQKQLDEILTNLRKI